MAVEENLELNVVANTGDAAPKVREVSEAVKEVTAATAEQAAASSAHTAALSEEEAAELRAAAVEGEHAQAVRALGAAYSEASSAVAEMATAATTGGKAYAEATFAARDAVAALQAQVASMQARGGPITPAMVADMEAFDLAVQRNLANTEKAAGGFNRMGFEANAARGNIGGLARALASAGGPVAEFVLPVLLLEGTLKLLPQLVKTLEDATASLTTKVYNAATGFHDEAEEVDKASDALAKHDQHVKAVHDSEDLLRQAQQAAAGGVIAFTDNVTRLTTEFLVHQAALHGVGEVTDDYAKRIKALGLTFHESFTDVRVDAKTFMDEYTRLFKVEGKEVADAWAEENKKAIEKYIDAFHKAGEMVPADLQKIIDKLGLHGKAWDDNFKAQEKVRAKLAEIGLQLKHHQEDLDADIRKINEHRAAQEKAADDELRTLRTSLDAQLAALNQQHRDELISDEDYRKAFAEVQDQEVTVRREHDKAIAQIDADADKRISEDNRKAAEHREKLEQDQKAEIGQLDALKLKQQEIIDKTIEARHVHEAAVDAQIEKSKALNLKIAETRDLSTNLAEVAFPKVIGAIQTMGDVVDVVVGKFDALGVAMERISVGGGGGADAGAGATPGSEGA